MGPEWSLGRGTGLGILGPEWKLGEQGWGYWDQSGAWGTGLGILGPELELGEQGWGYWDQSGSLGNRVGDNCDQKGNLEAFLGNMMKFDNMRLN